MHGGEIVNLACSIQTTRFVDVHEARTEVQTHSQIISNSKVQVGTVVKTTVKIAGIHIVICFSKVTNQTTLREVSTGYKVFQTFSTTRYVDIDVRLHSRFFEHFVVPVYIRMSVWVGTVFKQFQIMLCKHFSQTIVSTCLVD